MAGISSIVVDGSNRATTINCLSGWIAIVAGQTGIANSAVVGAPITGILGCISCGVGYVTCALLSQTINSVSVTGSIFINSGTTCAAGYYYATGSSTCVTMASVLL